LEDLARRHNEETASLRSRMWERATYYGLASDPPDDQKWCLAQYGPVKSSAHQLHGKGLREELARSTQLLLIDDHLHFVPATSEENTGEIAMLVEMADIVFGHAVPNYPGHNAKDGLSVETSHLVLVLEAGGVKRGP
jgi:hypothetical protein